VYLERFEPDLARLRSPRAQPLAAISDARADASGIIDGTTRAS
jgi:hypothetical protein